MADPKDRVIENLKASLNLAFRLMTQYQRDRHKKLMDKFKSRKALSTRSVLRQGGRPRAFKGTIPSASTLLATRMAEDERLHNDR